MTPIFEAKYISIKWYGENTILKINDEALPISVEIESDSIYNIELQAYTRIKKNLIGQIAFHIIDSNSNITPYFVDASNNKIPLLKIVNPSNNKVLWIENGVWSKQYKSRNSSLWNHTGDSKIIFNDITCNINIRSNSFTREQLDLYLNDFRNDFWYLILKKDSITQGDVKNTKVTLLNNDTSKLISKFVEYIEKILENPKKELREIQILKDIKKVKPIAKTFMEIATGGFKRKLTSRDTAESYNVADNKYIYYILQRVYNIVLYMFRASEHLEEIYENKYNFDKKRLNSFSDIKTIDKESYENEIFYLKNKVREEKINLENSILFQDETLKQKLQEELNSQISIQEQIANAINLQEPINNQNEFQRYIIKLENRQNDFGNTIQFFGKIKKYESPKWDDFGENNYFSLEFDLNIFHFISPNQEYDIVATSIYDIRQTNQVVIHKIFFTHILELRPLNLDIYQNNKLEYKTIYIKLQSKQNDFNDKIGFWGKGKNNIRDDWFAFRQGESLSFEFSKNKFDSVLHEWSEYKISGYIRKSKFQRLNGSIIHKRFFEYISDIEIYSKSTAQQALDRLESQRVSLEMTNWKRQLNYQEQQEQENERTALKKSRDLLKEKQEDNLKLLKGIEPKLYKLKLLLDSFSTLEIKQDSYFPNSMTFVQNPNYQGAYSFYKKINDTVGVDEDLFLQLQLVEKIGLMDMPTIYERWCLLQIIKVLVDKFRFQPEKNWKKKLANQITGDINKTRDVRIKFTNASIGREVDLWYEKILPNKKRPDFILDIKSTFNTMHTHQLIMDAKFHEKVDIEKQISLLYHTKNYSENETNTVFILHPDVNKSIKNKRTPKKWGSDAYYGEIDMFNYDWDSKNPNHKYGAILLSPITNKGGYLDNLQRLIGMSMQYNLEDNSKILLEDLEQKKKMLNPEPKEKVFCLVCGSDKLQGTKTPTNREHGYRYNFICDECEHLYEYNYCWQCHHRLIKNGAYWSYHSSQILEPFNIKCPNCSELLRL